MELQESILRLLSRSHLTQTQMVKALGYDEHSAVDNAVQKLRCRVENNETGKSRKSNQKVKKCQIQIIERTQPQKPTNRRLPIYAITEKGIERVLEILNEYEFWGMIFFQLEHPTNVKNLIVDEFIQHIIHEYEKKVLKLPIEKITPPLLLNTFDWFRTLSIRKHVPLIDNDVAVAILDILSYNQSLTKNRIANMIRKIYSKLNIGDNSIQKTLESLSSRRLIQKITSDKQTKYKLLHSGFVVALYHIYHDLDESFDTLTLSRLREGLIGKLSNDEIGLAKRLPLIINCHKHLFPDILSKKARINLNINNYYLLYLFIIPYFETQKDFLYDNNLTNYIFLSAAEQIIGKKEIKKLKNYYESGIRMLAGKTINDNNQFSEEEVANFRENSKKIEMNRNPSMFKRLIELEDMIVSWELEEHPFRHTDFSNKDHYNEIIQKKITFDYFLLFSEIEPKIWNQNFRDDLQTRCQFEEKKSILILNIADQVKQFLPHHKEASNILNMLMT